MSRADIRRLNLVRSGEEILPGNRGIDADLPADLDLVVGSLEDGRRDVPYYGVGFGAAASDAGAYPISTAQVRVETDGSVIVLSGSTEMGQGSKSLLAQIVAEEFGIDLQSVSVVQSDTSASSYERTTGASRTTTLAGLSVQRACADARGKLRAMAAELWACDAAEVRDTAGASPARVDRLWASARWYVNGSAVRPARWWVWAPYVVKVPRRRCHRSGRPAWWALRSKSTRRQAMSPWISW